MKGAGYKSAPANQNKGYKTHGSFRNMGQKAGKTGAIAKEKNAPIHADKIMQKVVDDMRKQKRKKGIAHTGLLMGLDA